MWGFYNVSVWKSDRPWVPLPSTGPLPINRNAHNSRISTFWQGESTMESLWTGSRVSKPKLMTGLIPARSTSKQSWGFLMLVSVKCDATITRVHPCRPLTGQCLCLWLGLMKSETGTIEAQFWKHKMSNIFMETLSSMNRNNSRLLFSFRSSSRYVWTCAAIYWKYSVNKNLCHLYWKYID